MIRSLTIDKDAGTVTIVADLQKPERSASGKTLVVCSTHDPQVRRLRSTTGSRW